MTGEWRVNQDTILAAPTKRGVEKLTREQLKKKRAIYKNKESLEDNKVSLLNFMENILLFKAMQVAVGWESRRRIPPLQLSARCAWQNQSCPVVSALLFPNRTSLLTWLVPRRTLIYFISLSLHPMKLTVACLGSMILLKLMRTSNK